MLLETALLFLISYSIVYLLLTIMKAQRRSFLEILLTASILTSVYFFSGSNLRLLAYLLPILSIIYMNYFHGLSNFMKAFLIWMAQYLASVALVRFIAG